MPVLNFATQLMTRALHVNSALMRVFHGACVRDSDIWRITELTSSLDRVRKVATILIFSVLGFLLAYLQRSQTSQTMLTLLSDFNLFFRKFCSHFLTFISYSHTFWARKQCRRALHDDENNLIGQMPEFQDIFNIKTILIFQAKIWMKYRWQCNSKHWIFFSESF